MYGEGIMRATSQRFPLVLALISALVVTACGGGGGSTSSTNPPTDTNPAVTLGSRKTVGSRLGVNTYTQFGLKTLPAFQSVISASAQVSPKVVRIPVKPEILSYWNESTKKMTDNRTEWDLFLGKVDILFKARIVPVIMFHTDNPEMADTDFGSSPERPWRAWPVLPETQAATAQQIGRLAAEIAKKNPDSDFIIEVGNELNYNLDWNSRKDDYANLLFQAVDEVKTVAPRAIVMPTAFAFKERNDNPNPDPESNATGCVDWLSRHPRYGELKAIGLQFYNNLKDRKRSDGTFSKGKGAAPEDMLGYLQQIRSKVGNRLFVASETGANSATMPEEIVKVEGSASTNHYQQQSQSNYVARYFLTSVMAGFDLVILYELTDKDPEAASHYTSESEKFFGLLTASGVPKASGSVLNSLVTDLRDAEFIDLRSKTEDVRDTANDYKLFEAKFKLADGREKYVRWLDRWEWSDFWPDNTIYPRKPTVYDTPLQH